MPRIHADWLTAYLGYASYTEAPKHMHFWTGVSTIAGALRRKVWIDQVFFQWHPNFYIILVAPPGVVSKTTTADIGMRLLRQVPDVNFGPDIVTWPSLVEKFSEAKEEFLYQDLYWPMCALTLSSGEFGNLLDPQDKQMVDLLVALWDGKAGAFTKSTKNSGSDTIVNPWINLIGCTTPSWIAGNFPEYMIGGGFTSRTIFVYADKKAKYVAYPGLDTPNNLGSLEQSLVADLTDIATNCIGEYKLTPDAISWGRQWYTAHYNSASNPALDPERFGGYLARKQTHIHKLALVLAISGGHRQIEREHLEVAHTMVTDLEPDMQFVFNKIGRSDNSMYAEKLIAYVHSMGTVDFHQAYRFVHAFFPSMRDFEDILAGTVKAGYIKLTGHGNNIILQKGLELPAAANKAGGAKTPPAPKAPPPPFAPTAATDSLPSV